MIPAIQKPTQCLASQAMSSLLEKRSSYPRALSMEIPIILLAAVAIVETVVYTALALLALIFAPCSTRPLNCASKLLQSSSFALLWTFSYAILNLFPVRLPSDEIQIRSKLQSSLPCFYRTVDDQYFTERDRINQIEIDRLERIERERSEQIEKNRSYLKELLTKEVLDLDKASPALIQAFKDVDDKFYPFVFAKTAFLLACTDKPPTDFEHYFKSTKTIMEVRAELDAPMRARLKELLQDSTTFQNGLTEADKKEHPKLASIFTKLAQFNGTELQGNFFKVVWGDCAKELIKKDAMLASKAFICSEIFSSEQDVKELLERGVTPRRLAHYVQVKTAFLLIYGKKKDEDLSHFFHSLTNGKINKLRNMPVQPKMTPERLNLIENDLNSLENFEKLSKKRTAMLTALSEATFFSMERSQFTNPENAAFSPFSKAFRQLVYNHE